MNSEQDLQGRTADFLLRPAHQVAQLPMMAFISKTADVPFWNFYNLGTSQ